MPKSFSTVDARNRFSEMVNRAAFGKERVLLTRRGKALAALVPIEDVTLIQRLEEYDDFKAAEEAWKEQGGEEPELLENVISRLGIKL